MYIAQPVSRAAFGPSPHARGSEDLSALDTPRGSVRVIGECIVLSLDYNAADHADC